MEEAKKRKMEESTANHHSESEEHLKSYLDPLRKDQLINLLVKLGTQYPSVAVEITSLASADPIHRKLFVRGLAWETTSQALCAAYLKHGEIEEGAVIVDKVTGKSRGYGFITYKHMESTQSALREPTRLIDGRMAACNLACEGLTSGTVVPDQTQRKLYIGGLSPDITSETLLNFFSRHGEIEEGSVAYDKDTNKSRCFGFITYKTAEATKRAIDAPNKILGGRNITVKFADTPKSRAVQIQQPATMVPVAIPQPVGYAQPSMPQYVGPPVGYSGYPQSATTYPQSATTYSHTESAYPQSTYSQGAFQNPAPAAAVPSPYSAQTPISYAQYSDKRDQIELPIGPPSGYQYYMGRQ